MTTYEMQLTDWDVAYDHASKWEFPVNPQVINLPLTMDRQIDKIPYGQIHVIISGGGIKSRELVLTGLMHGASKWTDFNNLSQQVKKNDIRRFWISSDKFYYVLGTGIRSTMNNERTQFVDYVGTLLCISPFAYSTAVSRQYVVSLTSATATTLNDATGSSTGAFTNAGNAPSLIKWTIVNTSSSNITRIEIGDKDVSGGAVDGTHILSWKHGTGLASGKTLVIYSFKYVNTSTYGTIKSVRLNYSEESSVEFGSVTIKGENAPWVDEDTTNQDFSIKLTGCDNTVSVTADWFDTYTG